MFGIFSRNTDVPQRVQKLEAGFWPEMVGQVRVKGRHCVENVGDIKVKSHSLRDYWICYIFAANAAVGVASLSRSHCGRVVHCHIIIHNLSKVLYCIAL